MNFDYDPKKKRILFLSGTRADFGKIKSLIKAVENSSEFEAHIFVTGMHLLSRYGYTVMEIELAGFRNIFTYINQIDSSNAQMDLVLTNTVQGLAYYVREFPPNLIVVHGDRVEALAGAIVGALNNILVAHIEGGEISGTIDELIRHSTSKLSHLHFVANDEAKRRLVQMGELPKSVLVIGSPDIDVMLSDNLPTLDDAKNRYELYFEDYCIFVYHSITTELNQLRRNIHEVIQALRASQMKFLVLFPNNDAGSDIIMEAIDTLHGDPYFRVLPSIRFEYFLTLLKNATCIVGNSSSGIREAPVYGVPTINIGTRQHNRFRHLSIRDVREDCNEILDALRHLPPHVVPSLHFGNGQSANLFIDYLRNPNLWLTNRQKQFQDVNFTFDQPLTASR